MLRVAVPNKGALSEAASEMLSEAGYRRRSGGSKDLSLIDRENDVEFYFLRPKDIAVYVGSGRLELGITGRDLAADSMAEVDDLLDLGFGHSTFRYAGPAGAGWTTDRLAGSRIATSYPNIVRKDLRRRGVEAEVIRLDVVGSGRTLKVHDLEAFGDVLCDSMGVLIARTGAEITPAMAQIRARLQGVVFAQQYMMLDYDCPKELLESVSAITPGIESPTVSPMADPAWVAVRSMVPRRRVNAIMDELAAAGAKAIIATDIRSCRMG